MEFHETRSCLVRFSNSAGVRQIAEVAAETLFEAAVLGIRAISQRWAEEPAPNKRIEVEVRATPVRHEVTLKRIRTWLDSASVSPKERLLKERLRGMLAG